MDLTWYKKIKGMLMLQQMLKVAKIVLSEFIYIPESFITANSELW